MVYCPRCGNPNDDAAQFCIKCGQSLAVRPEAMGPAPAPPPARRRSLGRTLLFTLLALVVVAAVAGVIYYLTQHLKSGGDWIAYRTEDPDDTLSLWVIRPNGQDRDEVMSGVNRIDFTSVPIGDQQYKYSPFSPEDNRMLFKVYEGDEQTLYTYALGEAKARTIVQGMDNVDYRFSPEGNRVAVAIQHEGEGSLQVIDPDGQNKVTLPIGDYRAIRWHWFPNSSQVILHLYDGEHTLVLMDADGEDRSTLVGQLDGIDWRVSLDGDRIAYSATEGNTWDVYAAEADGSDPIRLAGGLARASVYAFSPDSRKLIMSTSTDGYSYDLYLMETDGTGRVTLASDMETAYGEFLRGGKHIMFQVKKDGLWSLYLTDVEGGDQSQIARRVDTLTSALTPNGRTLVLGLKKGGDWDVYAVEVATGEQVSLLSNADDIGRLIALDDNRVLFSAGEGDNWSLYVARLDGEENVVLAGPADAFDGYDVSPDGRRVVYSEEKLGVSRLYVIGADGKNREKLADDGFAPIWSE